MKRTGKILLVTFLLTMSMCFTAFAGTWKQSDGGWWWQEAKGEYPVSAWQWIDGNGDGIAECYYFGPDGYLLTSSTTPDGYTVNQDGAWVENGAVRQKALTPTAKLYLMDEGRRIYEAASLKTSELSSMAATAQVNMNMSIQGESIEMGMTMDMKYKDLNTSNMKFLSQTNTSFLGQNITGTMFYTDGYYYMDMSGQKMKMAMNLDEMVAEVNKSTQISSMDTSYMKDFQVSTDSEGNTVITYDIDSQVMMAQVNSIYASMGMNMEGYDIKLRDMNGTSVVSPEGYCRSEVIHMVMDMSIQGETVSTDMNMDVHYTNPGQPVDFALPSTDGYQEMP